MAKLQYDLTINNERVEGVVSGVDKHNTHEENIIAILEDLFNISYEMEDDT